MKERTARLLNVILLCVFVNFVFSNTMFMHTHVSGDGHTITHSHPYLPTTHHAHSASSIDLLAQFNATAASMECVTTTQPDSSCNLCGELSWRDRIATIDIDVSIISLRGPPAE